MKPGIAVAGVAVAALAAWLWLNPSGPAPAQAQAPAKAPRWQYAVSYHSDLMALGEKSLNGNLTKLGEQGWELVAVTPGIRGDKGKEVAGQTSYSWHRFPGGGPGVPGHV
jgi:hypothetical protein